MSGKGIADTLGKIGQEVVHTVENVGHALGDVGQKLGLQFGTSGIIFVTGSTGVVGSRVASRLLKSGYPTVRVGVRHPDHADELNKLGAEVADFCWDREDTYKTALEGVKSVFCTTPYHEAWEQRFPAFLKACKEAGVKNFVKVSFYHARKSGDPFQQVPLVKLHGNCDELLEKSGISYTILAATHFMSNPFVFQGREIRRDQKPAPYYGASADHGVNYISPNDIAEVATRALLDPRSHHNKEYTLTGPVAIKDQQVADMLGKHLDKPIMYTEQPLEFFGDQEKMSGVPEFMVKDLMALEKIKASGKEEDISFISKDVEKICGRPAETFEEYLRQTEYMTKQELKE